MDADQFIAGLESRESADRAPSDRQLSDRIRAAGRLLQALWVEPAGVDDLHVVGRAIRVGAGRASQIEDDALPALLLDPDIPLLRGLFLVRQPRLVDPGALARAVAVLAADSTAAKAMGARGAAYVAEHASWQARADQTGFRERARSGNSASNHACAR